MVRCLPGAFLVMVGCSAASPPPVTQAPAQIPLDSSYSSSSASGSGYSSADYSGGKGLSVPQRSPQTDPTVLVVRPDLIRVSFAVREVRPTPALALDAARSLAGQVSGDLVRRLGAGATVELRGLGLSKLVRDEKPVGFTATVDGVVQLPLAPQEDFWARSRRYTSVIDATQGVAEATQSAQDPMRAVSFDPPEVTVKDPESYRAELVQRWVGRAKEFAEAAQIGGATLVIRDCEPPMAVTPYPVSVQEVRLELHISCRIETAEAPVSRPVPAVAQ